MCVYMGCGLRFEVGTGDASLRQGRRVASENSVVCKQRDVKRDALRQIIERALNFHKTLELWVKFKQVSGSEHEWYRTLLWSKENKRSFKILFKRLITFIPWHSQSFVLANHCCLYSFLSSFSILINIYIFFLDEASWMGFKGPRILEMMYSIFFYLPLWNLLGRVITIFLKG